MQDFSSISVSSYEAGSLAERLTEQSRDGWTVVAIVPTGSTVTAYLCRDAGSATGGAQAVTEAPVDEPAAASIGGPEPAASEPEPVLAGSPTAITPEPATSEAPTEPTVADLTPTTADSATETAAESSETTTAPGAAPAGWYADPSGRFELRYWDGGQWTEHVSRSGQQYTDPPVA